MRRDSESRLLAFCVEQRSHFDASAWTRCTEVPAIELAAVVRYLAGVSWYGHQAQLARLADALSPAPFATLARDAGFDPGRFGGLLQAHLRHAAQSVA